MDYRDLQAGKSASGFWFRARRDLLERLVRRALAGMAEAGPRILSVGCGTGSDLAVLGAFGRVVAVDCDRRALALVASPLAGQCQAVDAAALPFSEAQFDVVVAFEVLEHLEDDARAVAEAWRVLRPGGTLLVSVPACPALFGPHDRALGHYRRYRREQVRALLSRFSRVEVRYWNSLLFPGVALARLARSGARARVQTGKVPPVLDGFFGAVLRWENRCLLRGWTLPFGLSLVACGRR